MKILTGGGHSPSADGTPLSVQVSTSTVHANGSHISVHRHRAAQHDHGNVVPQGTPVPSGVL